MEVEESVHYDVSSVTSDYEWSGMYRGGKDSVRIGPELHAAALPMSHQLHCVEALKDELKEGRGFYSSSQKAHTEHCANYLRQWALCRADLTLEPGDFTHRDFDLDRKGATHECLDWSSIYNGLDLDWNAWISFWTSHHLYKFVQFFF